MAKFCTQCGTSNTAENAFCEGCGHALNKPQAAATTAEPAAAPVHAPRPPRQPWSPRALRMVLGAAASVVVVGGVGLYFALATPTASRAKLLELTQAAYSESSLRGKMFELCLNNINYSATVHINPADVGTREWMDLLVQAGVYQAGEVVTTGGFFAQQRLQYLGQPELAQWKKGNSLCLAKSVAVVDVIDIQPPEEVPVSGKDNAPSLTIVKAKTVFQAKETPSWLNQPGMQAAVQKRLSDWKLEEGQLRRTVDQQFAYSKGEWVTGGAVSKAATELRNEARSERGSAQAQAPSASGGGIFGGLAKMFSMNSHPLVGSWRLDLSGMDSELLGRFITTKDKNIEFTNDSVLLGGKLFKSSFEVDENTVTVTLEDGGELVIDMLNDRTFKMQMGLMTLKYQRQ
jgi:hypothetical protein